MNRTVQVTVLQDDIDNGEPRMMKECAVARAVSRDTGFTARVSGRWIRVYPPDGRPVLYLAPECVLFFACRFDEGRPVEPFKFEMSRI